MGLFDKKYCDICSEKIGLLGNRKLEDGNLCKDCAKKLSPFFDDRRNSTVAEIGQQLAYRQENEQKVAAFNPTKVIGGRNIICFDETNKTWLFSKSKKWKESNPDIISFSQVTGCDVEVKENEYEIYRQNREGKRESYSPRRYNRDYDFYITIHVNSPYFDQIRFQLNDKAIQNRFCTEYKEAERDAEEINSILTGASARAQANEETSVMAPASEEAVHVNAAAPKAATTCPNCNATTTPDASGRCEFCGGAF